MREPHLSGVRKMTLFDQNSAVMTSSVLYYCVFHKLCEFFAFDSYLETMLF